MTSALAAAAQQRSHDTRHRTIKALRDLDAAGAAVTFANVARTAGVSRSWLYRQPEVRAEIDRLRRTTTVAGVPSTQCATTDSQSRRIEATLDEIRRLKAENHQLREQVAKRFGQQRADGLT